MGKNKNKALLANLDPEVTRVKVETEKGHKKWRELDEVADSDTILLKDTGEPLVMKGSPGRKSTPHLEASNEVVAEILRKKQETMARDPLLRIAKDSPESSELLHLVMVGLAEESASIGFERAEAERDGKGTSTISVRRINALKSVAETWLRRKEQVADREIDIQGPAFKALFGFILETFRLSLEDTGLRPEMVETVFAKLSTRMKDSWEDEASHRMRDKNESS
jgi:hypothetical protein